jgi:hypothetical protein
MAVGDEIGKIKKELEKERSDDAESKPDSPFGPKLGEMAEKMGSSAQGQESQSPDALKKQISDIVRKKVDSSFSDIKDNLKGLEKISDLEGKINVITEKLNSQILNPPAQAKPSMGGSSIAKELASFGEEVDFQTELYQGARHAEQEDRLQGVRPGGQGQDTGQGP